MQQYPTVYDPHTPTDLPIDTPSLNSSPDTPQQGQGDIYLQTPALGGQPQSGIPVANPHGSGMEGKGNRRSSDAGLGYGVVGKGDMGPPRDVVLEDGDEAGTKGFPERERLRGLKRRLEEMESAGDDQRTGKELKGMVRTLLTPCLDELPFLHQQLDAQRETIRTLQQQARLSEQMMSIERSRFAAERHSWQVTSQALLKQKADDIASGVRPNRILELDVGYHQELEAANKRLEMDNRLMAPRLVDTQRQIDKLVTELQHLRSQVVISTHQFDAPVGAHPPLMPQPLPQYPPGFDQSEIAGPSRSERPVQPKPVRRSSSPKGVMRSTLMGDARTEHLLLAARKVRAMRATDDRVGRLTLDELKKGGVVGPDGGLGYSEGYGGIAFDEDGEDEEGESEIEDKPTFTIPDRRNSITGGKGKSRVGAAPPTPGLLPKKSHHKKKQPPSTPGNSKNTTRQPLTTPGGSNFSDLLRAAELATRPGSPTGVSRPLNTSATRSTNYPPHSREETPLEDSVAHKKARKDTTWHRNRPIEGTREDEDEDAEGEAEVVTPEGRDGKGGVDKSALDLLLQASQIDSPEGSNGQRGGKGKGKEQSISHIQLPTLAPPLELRQSNQILDHMIDPSLADLPRQPHGRTTANATPYAPATSSTSAVATPRQRPRGLSNASLIGAEADTPGRNNWASLYQDSPFDEGIHAFSPPLVAKRERFASISGMGGMNGNGDVASGSGVPENPPAFNSPTGGTVPGLGKYVHLTSSMPARRMRSPYLKWTVEEDELLARAVAMHGEKWDLVSKGVPTRSYHQVRQRWLRKTGAFDKKQGSMVVEPGPEEGEGQRATSPTPVGGINGHSGTQPYKKRRMSLLGA